MDGPGGSWRLLIAPQGSLASHSVSEQNQCREVAFREVLCFHTFCALRAVSQICLLVFFVLCAVVVSFFAVQLYARRLQAQDVRERSEAKRSEPMVLLPSIQNQKF